MGIIGLSAIMVVLITVTGITITGISGAFSSIDPNVLYSIENRASGRVWTVDNVQPVNYALVLLYSNGHHAHQQWQLKSDPQKPFEGNIYNFINKNSSKAVSTMYGSKRDCARMVLWDFIKNEDQQKIKVKDVGGGYYALEMLNSGKVLQPCSSYSEGAFIGQKPYVLNNFQQHWKFNMEN